MKRIKFYYKPGCWFCDQAEEMLKGFKERYGLEIEKIDITQDGELYELYRFEIPVIEFEDGTALHGRIRKSLSRNWIQKGGFNEDWIYRSWQSWFSNSKKAHV